MQNRKSEEAFSVPFGRKRRHAPFTFLFSILLAFVAGCASPSDPVERKPPIPSTVKDLAAAQSGGDVILTFTVPNETTERRPLADPPTIEIYRVNPTISTPDKPAASANHPTLLVTIPAAMVDQYSTQGTFRYPQALAAQDFLGKDEQTISYMVRTRASEKRESADSNAVTVHVYAVAKPIEDLKADVTHAAIVLTWTAPEQNLAGLPSAITDYKVYRSAPESNETEKSARKVSPRLIGEAPAGTTIFSDPNFEFGKNYVYVIRSVVTTPSGPLESADSNSLGLTPKDVFPPAAPQGLEVVFVPAQGDVAGHLELSWAISPETDIAGYNVYRNGDENVSGTRQNKDLLLTPAFRDMNVEPGHRYSYTVTAVDRSGNESARSEAASAEVSAANQTTQ
jgi:hypothetical protein